MAYGDRIYARLSRNGEKLTEFMIECVSDMTELLGEVRAAVRKCRGLCRLYVRNMTRGWCLERPLMLYTERYPSPEGWQERIFAEPEPTPAAPARCIMPWETH